MKNTIKLFCLNSCILLFLSFNVVGQNDPPEVLSFFGEPAGFISLQYWEGGFSQEGGTVAVINSCLGNSYFADINTGTITGELTHTGIDTITLTIYNLYGYDSEMLVFEVFDDHNPLSDTIGESSIEMKPLPEVINGDRFFYTINLPLQSFVDLYGFQFEPTYVGDGIVDIKLLVVEDSLVIDLECDKAKSERLDLSFAIQIVENDEEWFQTGIVILLLPDIDCFTHNNLVPYSPGYETDISFYCELSELTWKVYNTSMGVILVDSFSTTNLYGGVDTVLTFSSSWLQGNDQYQGVTLEIKDQLNSCGPTFLFQMLNTNSINMYDINQGFVLYPNPVKSKLNVSFTTIGDKTVSVIGIDGSVISTVGINQKEVTLDVSCLNKGIYLLRVKTGDQFSSKIFIKQ